jgi:hypothetical protein
LACLIAFAGSIPSTPVNSLRFCRFSSPDVCPAQHAGGTGGSVPPSTLRFGDNLIDPLNLALLLAFVAFLATFILAWVYTAKQRVRNFATVPSALLGICVDS